MENKIHVLEAKQDLTVFLDGEELDPQRSQAHTNHSPDGFSWGFLGSGPSQLALAVMLELYNNSTGYRRFRDKYIATLKKDKPFKIMFSDADIVIMLAEV